MAATSWHTWIYLCVIGVFVATKCLDAASPPCPCPTTDGCIRPVVKSTSKEVYVVTTGHSDFNSWRWDAVTTVLATEDNPKTEVMCNAHLKEKRYGFTVSMTYADHFNMSSNITQQWIKKVVDRRTATYADIVAVNLLDTFLNMDTKDVDKLTSLLESLKKQLTPKSHLGHPVELTCVVPWKPPYYGDMSITQKTLYYICDWLMIEANSFANIDNKACRAQATVPFTKLALGIDEYASEGIQLYRIILGVPWHGYQYKCKSPIDFQGDTAISKCMLDNTKKNANNVTYCDIIGSRKMITIGDIVEKHSKEMKKSGFSLVYNAPVYDHYDNKTKEYTQVWYEDIQSLRLKYQYAHDFNLKGIAVYYAEDLASEKTKTGKGYNKAVWDWVLHGILHIEVKKTPPPQYHPDVVAGAAIGCLLLGVAMGVVFTCLALRHRVKKKEVPFKSDRMEYHDDEDLNL